MSILTFIEPKTAASPMTTRWIPNWRISPLHNQHGDSVVTMAVVR